MTAHVDFMLVFVSRELPLSHRKAKRYPDTPGDVSIPGVSGLLNVEVRKHDVSLAHWL